MHRRFYLDSCLLAFIVAFVAYNTSWAQTTNPVPQKLAFLVGVDQYQKDGLSDLNYSDDDVRELEQVLRGQGFKVDLLVGPQATLAQINRRWTTFLDAAKHLNKSDIVFVALTGHGLQLEVQRGDARASDSFFCPVDAQKNEPATLLSISGLMSDLDRASGTSQNLLVIDACRDDPTRGAKGLDGSRVRELPAKLSVLFACSSGQQSFESDVVKHGVFTHVLLEGLRGAAANPRGEVTWLSLASHVSTEVPTRVPKLIPGLSKPQRPNLVSNSTSNPVLATARPANATGVTVGGATPQPMVAPGATTKLPPSGFDKFADVEVDAEYEKYLTSNAVLMEATGAKMIRLPEGRYVLLAIVATPLNGNTPTHKLTASKILRTLALGAAAAQKKGVQVCHTETVQNRTVVVVDAGGEDKSFTELMQLTSTKVETVVKGMVPVGRWSSKDGTVAYMAMGAIVDRHGEPILD